VSKKLELHCLVKGQIDDWRGGEAPDAAAFLGAHPELQDVKSLAIDLICEEYRLRTAKGDTIAKSTFCDRFPAYRRSVAKMIEVQEFLDQCPQFAVQPDESEWPRPGARLLGFEIVDLLGTGAFARVYLARERALGGRLVVIKVSRHGAAEAATLGRLSHANIVPIHSVQEGKPEKDREDKEQEDQGDQEQEDKDQAWTVICMPFLGTATAVDLLDAAKQARADDDGGIVARVAVQSRKSECAGRPAPDDEAQPSSGPFAIAIARLGMQLAEGLHAAHAEGIVHRDLKPSNVLLAWSGQPMLLDFNLSTDVAIENFRVGGTLAYMAPEQIEALQHDPFAAAANLDPRADIYSLGVLLFELLTGRLPAQPTDVDHLPLDAYQPWLECKSAAAPRLDNTCPIDPRLSSIVLKCLAIRPSDRYAAAAELAADLSALLRPPPAAEPVSLPATSTASAPMLRASRRRGWLLVVTLVAALGLIFLGPGLLNSLPHNRQQAGSAADDVFRRFLTHFEQRNWSPAHAAALELSQWNRAAGMALAGWCSYELGNPRLAYDEFGAAHLAGCRQHEIVIRYADTAASLNEFDLAIRIQSSLLTKNPSDIHALRGRIHAYLQSSTKKNTELPALALQDATQLAKLQPESPDALLAAFQAHDYAPRKLGGESPVAAELLVRLFKCTRERKLSLGGRYRDIVAGASAGPENPRPINELSPRRLSLPKNLRREDFAAPLTAQN